MNYGEGAARMQRDLPKESGPFAGMNDRNILREYGRWHREVHLVHDIPEDKRQQFSAIHLDQQRLLDLLKNPQMLAEELAAGASTEAAMAKEFLDYWQQPQKSAAA